MRHEQNEHTRAGYTLQYSDFIWIADSNGNNTRIVYHRRERDGSEPDDIIHRLTLPDVLEALNKALK